MKLVIDASVSLKWILDPIREPDFDKARMLATSISDRQHDALQPVHWRGEVAAVVARQEPDRVAATLDLLYAIPVSIIDTRQVLERASFLVARIRQHLFDTLYHAVALEAGATLITADERYFEAAKVMGSIERLADWKG